MIDFMGKSLKNPIIASSCIATETAKSILNLAHNGVQGAILKSCADYTRTECSSKRQFATDSLGYTYASSPFEKEILTLSESVSLLRELRNKTDILLIPSFTATSLNPHDWISACKILEKECADGIQLDFFYMGNLIGNSNFSRDLVNLLKELTTAIGIPIMPKLNINLPKDYIMPLLKESGIEYVSLLDSIRSPLIEYNANDKTYTLNDRLNPDTTSCFGNWQLPLTIGYTYTAMQYGFKVCAGGGVSSHDDVLKLLSVGATTVQSATFLTKHPNGKLWA